MATNRKRVLIIGHDIVGTRMSGAGLKNWEMATVLSDYCDVVLAAPEGTTANSACFELYTYTVPDPHLEQISRQSDVVLLSGSVWCQFPFLHTLEVPIVFDLWIPVMHEARELNAAQPLNTWHDTYQEYVRVLNEQLRRGDFFVCASERQRDYYLGLLEANLRITPELYAQDRTLRSLIDVVPIGLPANLPTHAHQVLKGRKPGIELDDRVVLWIGGIWEWFDPLTPIRAVAQLATQQPDLKLKLVFLGGRHPNPETVPEMNRYQEAVTLSRTLQLYNRHVFFINWIPYEERQNYLLEADLGISAHFEHLETRYSFRTRVLDYLWSGLPMVVTEGDVISDIVQEYDLGKVVAYGDVAGWVDALSNLLTLPDPRAAYAKQFERVRKQYTWEHVCRPLVRFCQSPHRAADEGLYESELERISRDKDQYIAGLEDALRRYHRTIIFRAYFRLQAWLSALRGKQ